MRPCRACWSGRCWNHPSIGIWTIINESWGIDLTDPDQRAWLSETYLWFKELDPTRLVVGNSACWANFHVVTDIADFHNYYAMPDHLEKWRKWTASYAGRPWWLFAHEYTKYELCDEWLTEPWYVEARPPAPDILQRGDEPLLVSEFGNWGLPEVEKLYACTDRCLLDENGICLGCHRSLDEINRWFHSNNKERLEFLNNAYHRQKAKLGK